MAGTSLRYAASLCPFFAFVLLASPAYAGEREKTTDSPFRYDDYRVRYDVNADGTYEQTVSYTKTVQQELAIKALKEDSFSYSASIAQGEMVEAWTQKAAGQRIPVPRDNFQSHTAGGHRDGGPFFSDQSSVSVVFPDVAIGDQVHLTWRLKVKEAIFPGQFTLREEFSPFVPYTQAEVIITVPASLKVRHQAWNLQRQGAVTENDRRIYRWTYRHPLADKWKQGYEGIERLEEEPVLLFSTLRDYRDITEAYGQRARPKAAVTPRIRTLAESITSRDAAPADRARALYEWIQKNITYGGNCIGIGAVVPRDLDVVLDNRIGDCKDRATLLQALLAAVEVPSTQALVNASDLYELPDVPVVANINHAINYLPTLDLFLDSTSPDTPFGRLPFGSADKPALLMDGYRPGLRTPPELGAADHHEVRTHLKVNADGSANGTVEVVARGLPAVAMRTGFRKMSAERRTEGLRHWLKSAGYDGEGELQLDEAAADAGEFRYRATVKLKDYLQHLEAGAFALRPLFGGPAAFRGVANTAVQEAPTRPRPCTGSSAREDYVIELPAGMKVLYLPQGRALEKGGLRYATTYGREGNAVTLTRTLTHRVARNVCAPALLVERQDVAREVGRDLRAQVLYQQTH